MFSFISILDLKFVSNYYNSLLENNDYLEKYAKVTGETVDEVKADLNKQISEYTDDNETLSIYTSLIKNELLKLELTSKEDNIVVTKNNNTLDAFTVVNKKNIPEEIFGIVKTIVRNCNIKKRFIEYNEFVNKAFYLFDQFSNEDKITILNFKKI